MRALWHCQNAGRPMRSSSRLLEEYVKFSRMVETRQVLGATPQADEISWNYIISGYVGNGRAREALCCFKKMLESGCPPSDVTVLAALKACSSSAATEVAAFRDGKLVKLESFELCKDIHEQASKFGHAAKSLVANRLADTYARCGRMVEAWEVFQSIQHCTVVSWTCILLGYAQNGDGLKAWHLYARMQQEGIRPDAKALVAALKACGSMAENERGTVLSGKLVKTASLARCRKVHQHALEVRSSVFVASTLVIVYGKCGSIEDAWKAFQTMNCRDAVSWNCMISAYAQAGQGQMVAEVHVRMREEAAEGILRTVEKRSFGSCSDRGMVLEARRVFERMPQHDVVAWNSLLTAYVNSGEGRAALDLFSCMKDVVPDAQTFLAALKSCTDMAAKEKGKLVGNKLVKISSLRAGKGIHLQATRVLKQPLDIYVASSLVDMYTKCGSMQDAHQVFENIQQPNLVAWTSIILGYAINGESEVALELYSLMKQQQPLIRADCKLFVAVLQACGSVGALETGKQVHNDILCQGSIGDKVVLCNSLLDFYAKCGCMASAEEVFQFMVHKDLFSWSSMLAGYGRQGDAHKVFGLLDEMQRQGFKPDGVTFMSVLAVCSHAGLVAKGKEYFTLMLTKFEVIPTCEHYSCMLDMLARANMLEEALDMAKRVEADSIAWMSLLSACKKWSNNVHIAREAFARLVSLDKTNASAYILMAGILEAAGLHDEAASVNGARRDAGARKTPGRSWWINPGTGLVNAFYATSRLD